jgi:MerR family transcriptional regulator, copper efflux regulator
MEKARYGMNIGETSRATGIPPKTIRYYDEIGLIRPAGRGPNRYRDYGEHEVHQLRFVARARAFGFSIEQCRELLALYLDHSRASSEVKGIALARIAEIDRMIGELKEMRVALATLAEHCHGDSRPHCPILSGLAHE